MRKSLTALAVLAALALGACGGSQKPAAATQPSVTSAFQKYGAIQDKFDACTAGLSTDGSDAAAYNACVDEANAAKEKVNAEEGIR